MNDLPVFITSDSVLHALRIQNIIWRLLINNSFWFFWYQNYEFLLKALEEGYLSTTLTNILDGYFFIYLFALVYANVWFQDAFELKASVRHAWFEWSTSWVLIHYRWWGGNPRNTKTQRQLRNSLVGLKRVEACENLFCSWLFDYFHCVCDWIWCWKNSRSTLYLILSLHYFPIFWCDTCV